MYVNFEEDLLKKIFHAIGIKLRGSDKQSSIWHHKEKE